MSRIAVVGAGIAGLACARALHDTGHEVRVFEKSRGVGGRMATRRTDQGTFDHGAQYFTARDPLFRQVVDGWLGAGIVALYAGRIVRLNSAVATALSHEELRYVATPGMPAPCRALGKDIDVMSECTVSAVTPGEEGWRVSWEEGGESGFDAVALAVPAVQALPLCSAVPALGQRVAQGSHAPCWAVMVHYAQPLPVQFDAAFISNAAVGWAMRDASRPGRVAGERWVLHATADWSRTHLEAAAATVAPELVEAFHAAAGISAKAIEIRGHRWRYALSPGLKEGCLWNAERHIGACGDWCADGRIEGAYLSGLALAAELKAAI